MTDHYRRSRLRKLQKRLVYDAKYMSDAIVSWLTFENGKDVNEASGAAVVVTTGEAATDVGATGLSRTATGVLGVAEIDLFHRPVEVPSVATATDTYRKTDVADVAVVRRPDQCLPTPEARPHGLGPALARFPVAGVVAGGQAHGRSLHRDGTIDPVDHRLVAKRRASVGQQQIFAGTKETQIFQFEKSVPISPSRQPPTITQVAVFVVLSFTQSQSSPQARPGAHQPQSFPWPIEALQH
ncbi:uncharacterized protein PG998_002095 [Apiospora kogelbergensis]|uniref:uncharacterized protein n=1 Tax=Apiospora kogelbergensis TaxID=1337665 RepID=UPI00312E6332